MKCTAAANDAGDICGEDFHGTVNGTSLCIGHVKVHREDAQREQGLGLILRQLEKITVADVLALQEKVAPLMAMAAGGMAGAMPARCAKTVGCLMTAGHVLDCITTPP